MPIFEFECRDCGTITELLVRAQEVDLVTCSKCGGRNLKKLISAHATFRGEISIPSDPADRCCASTGPIASCTGPGSCCGKH